METSEAPPIACISNLAQTSAFFLKRIVFLFVMSALKMNLLRNIYGFLIICLYRATYLPVSVGDARYDRLGICLFSSNRWPVFLERVRIELLAVTVGMKRTHSECNA